MSRKRLARRLLIILVVGCLAAAGGFVVKTANEPSAGTVTVRDSSDTPKTARALITVQGKTASFQYPSVLHQTKAGTLSSGDVEKFAFVSLKLPPWDLDIQVRQLPSGQLADDGSYNLCLHYPQQYTEQRLTVNGAAVAIMSDQNAGFSKVAFLTHNGLVAEVALTSTDTAHSDQLQMALVTVVQTWHWL